MLKLFTICMIFGILSTFLGSPLFWYNIFTRKTVWGDAQNNGLDRQFKIKQFVKANFIFFAGTTLITFLTYYFSADKLGIFASGSLVAVICICLCRLWGNAFYVHLNTFLVKILFANFIIIGCIILLIIY